MVVKRFVMLVPNFVIKIYVMTAQIVTQVHHLLGLEDAGVEFLQQPEP
jgi:hypothetical protein